MSARLSCWASSRVGTTMIARGWPGRLFSPARRASTGMPKARVLPEPVWARPSTSWPARPSGMTAAWTGVGAVMPWAARAVISSAGQGRRRSWGRWDVRAQAQTWGCFRSGWVRPARSHTGADPASLARRGLVTRSTGLARKDRTPAPGFKEERPTRGDGRPLAAPQSTGAPGLRPHRRRGEVGHPLVARRPVARCTRTRRPVAVRAG